MNEEMRNLEKYKTWEIVELPKENKLVECKWVFNIGCKVDETLERYKARWIAKGYTQPNLWSGLLGDFCISGKDKYCYNFIIIGN